MLGDAQIERWSRQILLPDVGGRGQMRLLRARVAVAGDGPVATRCVELLRRAGIPVTAGAVVEDAELVVDLDAAPDIGSALARRAAAAGTPLVRARLAGAAGSVDTLVGCPCGCCAGGEPRPGSGAHGPLAAPAAHAVAALAAAEVVAVLLAPPRRGRRQRFDLATGDFAGTVLEGYRVRRLRSARVSDGQQPALKLALATRGVRIDPSAHGLTSSAEPLPQSLELIVDGAIRVSVPVDAAGTAPAPFLLMAGEGRDYRLVDPQANGATPVSARVEAPPRFYGRRTAGGLPMRRVASVLGTHLLVHPAGACGFSVQGTPCRFCLEGARGRGDGEASVADVVEVVRAAFDEGAAQSVYLNSDAFDAEDGGLAYLAPYVEGIRKHFDTLVAVQVHPPRTDRWIDWAYALGVDALSFNLEIFDPQLLDRHCIGRMRYIGRQRYLDALGHAATVFPSGTVWSDLVLGLEPLESTTTGIETLAGLGVVPILSARRVLGTPFDPAGVDRLLTHLYRAVSARGINMGWVRDLVAGVAPLEAHPAGRGAALHRAVGSLARSRLGGVVARGLARSRRRLRVKTLGESLESAHH